MANKGVLYLLSFKAFSRFLLLSPVLIPFLQDKGLSLAQVISLTGVYSFSCAVFELPTGIIADKMGSKKGLLLGASCFFLAYLGYILLNSYWSLVIVNIMLGIATSFFSGTDSTLLYNYLQDSNRLKEFNKFEGRLYAVSTYSEAVAGLCASALAVISLIWNAKFQVVVAFLGFLLVVMLPKDPRNQSNKTSIKTIFLGIAQNLKSDKKLGFYLLLSSLLGLSTLALSWLSQAYMQEIQLPVFWFGIVWTGLNLLVGLGSSLSYRLETKFSLVQIAFCAAILIAFSFLLLSLYQNHWLLIILPIPFLFRGLSTPALRTLIHQHCKDDVRTSIFSLRSLLIRAFYGLTAMGIAYIQERAGLSESLLAMGLFILLMLPLMFWMGKK